MSGQKDTTYVQDEALQHKKGPSIAELIYNESVDILAYMSWQDDKTKPEEIVKVILPVAFSFFFLSVSLYDCCFPFCILFLLISC